MVQLLQIYCIFFWKRKKLGSQEEKLLFHNHDHQLVQIWFLINIISESMNPGVKILSSISSPSIGNLHFWLSGTSEYFILAFTRLGDNLPTSTPTSAAMLAKFWPITVLKSSSEIPARNLILSFVLFLRDSRNLTNLLGGETHNVNVQIIEFTVFGLSLRILKLRFLIMAFLNSAYPGLFPRWPEARDNAKKIPWGFFPFKERETIK